MYTVHFTNFNFTSPFAFARFDQAYEYGCRCGFEFSVAKDGVVWASWSPIGGLKPGQAFSS